MAMTDAPRYQELLEQKRELVFELLRLSNDVDLSEDKPEESADRYVEFVESREKLLERLRGMDEAIGAAAPEETGETAALLGEIRAMADQVVRREPELRKKAQKISVHFQRELKGINTRRQEAQSRGEYTKGLRYQQDA